MKQKWLVMLMALCVTWFMVSPLTVSAESSDVPKDELSDDWSDVDDTWGKMNEYGYANDMMIVMSLYDGLEDDPTAADMLSKTHVLSAHLEPEHAYRASLDFMIVVDRENITKYDDINLQVRFPAILIQESPNAIGFSVNGSQIDTWYDTFGIDCEEDVDLYYIDGTGTLMTMKGEDDHVFTNTAMDYLFSSSSGLPMSTPFQEALEDTMQMGKYEVAYMRLEFAFYAAPHQGKITASSVALNYWEGQRLMYNVKTTPAPQSYYYTAALNEDGTVTIPQKQAASQQIGWGWFAVGILLLAILGIIIVLGFKVRKRAHERGITGFMNIFLDYMKLTDEHDK